MMPFTTIVLIVAVYVAVAVLLLSLNITSRWRWWIKGGAIALTGIMFVVSYVGIYSLLGWPTKDQVPDRFSVIATRIVEPDRQAGTEGAVYLWLETVDDNNIPSGRPLAYQMPYTDELARSADRAQEMIDSGEEVQGNTREITESETQNTAGTQTGGEQTGGGGGETQGEHVDSVNLVFGDLPPVRLPNKGPL
jgi:hypothetical protein